MKGYQKENREKVKQSEAKWRDGNKGYMKEYQVTNKEQLKDYHKEYHEQNKDTICERSVKWRKDNPEKTKLKDQRYYQNNRERELQKSKERYQKNKERDKLRSKLWRENNKGKVNANLAKRRADKRQATPLWVNLKEVSKFYDNAQQLTEETGVEYQVDHFYPLVSDVVCGLHWEGNLRVITAKENNSKKNKLIEE